MHNYIHLVDRVDNNWASKRKKIYLLKIKMLHMIELKKNDIRHEDIRNGDQQTLLMDLKNNNNSKS